jgi:hypothetical protein
MNKKIMKTIYLIILILVVSLRIHSQQDSSISFGNDEDEIEYYFGFNLIPNASGALYHLALIKPEKDGTFKIRQLTKDGFIAQAKGKEQSLANPKGIDFFKKYQIDNPNVIDDIWRLRYQDYPYLTRDKVEPGWSTNDSIPYIPSPTQSKTLEKFGMFRLNDYIYGENAFRLLHFMGKPEWIKLYKESF